jgi:hypothetical protein
MKNFLLLAFLLACMTERNSADTASTNIPCPLETGIIQNPKTKVIYYVESDLRHVAAISPDGRLLWCRKVTPLNHWVSNWHIYNIKFNIAGDGAENILIEIYESGCGAGWIDEKTGEYTDSGSVL